MSDQYTPEAIDLAELHEETKQTMLAALDMLDKAIGAIGDAHGTVQAVGCSRYVVGHPFALWCCRHRKVPRPR